MSTPSIYQILTTPNDLLVALLSAELPQGGTLADYQAVTIEQTGTVPFIVYPDASIISDNFVCQQGYCQFDINYTQPDVNPVGYYVYEPVSQVIVGVTPLCVGYTMSYRTNPNILKINLSANQYCSRS